MRPPLHQYNVQGSPVVSLRAESFEGWLAGKSASFREEIRRNRRRLAKLGGELRFSDAQTLPQDLEAFLRLHAGRWEGRGVSGIASRERAWGALLGEIGASQVQDGRMRMLLLEVAGEPIAVQVAAAAGGEVVLLNGGWDERFARVGPAILLMVAAIEDAFARGEQRIDLCPGEQAFKLRLADDNDPVAWSVLLVPGARLPLTCARATPMLAGHWLREAGKRALSEEQAQRVRSVRRLLRRGG